MSEDGTLRRIAHHLVGAVRPLRDAFADVDSFRVLLRQLGWEVEDLPPSYRAVADQVGQAVDAIEALGDGATVEEILTVVERAGAVYRGIEALTDAPTGVDAAAFLAELPGRLFEYLLGRQLLTEAPGWYAAMEALGIVVPEDHPATATRPGFVRIRFDWDRIPEVLADPAAIPAAVYGWGTADLHFSKIAELVTELVAGLGLPASLDELSGEVAAALRAGATGPAEHDATMAVTLLVGDVPLPGGTMEPVGLMLTELPAEGDSLPGMVLLPKVPAGIADRAELGSGWVLTVRAGTDLATQLGIAVRPDGVSVRYPGAPGQQLPSAGFGVALGLDREEPILVLGQPERTRLELGSALVSASADVRAGDLEVRAGVDLDGLALVIEPGDADGFIGAALGGRPLRVELAFGLGWSSRTGLNFTAAAGLEVSVHPHLDTGVLRLDRVDLALRGAAGAGEPPSVRLTAAASFSGEIGPIAYSVDRFGVALPLRLTDGNAGPFDVAIEPLLPTGLGLVIDAGPVTGGGFVSYDPARGRYAGIVELDVFDIGIAAIAILDTRDAAGNDLPSPGFSFVAIVAVDLPPIQLGFGFTLTGIGGLAGLNRRLDTPALLSGIRSGAVDSILFPADPVRDAAQIVARIGTIFPVAPGRHVFGPMARIEWGTPALITIELAIVLEVPAPVTIALLGTATVRLPEDVPIVVLNVDVIGVLDQGRGLLAVDAALRDSSVAGFALGGDLAMRLAFGADANFALAVGGLHPHFDPPPGFPALRRVSLALGSGNPRIGIEGYLAVTSNSIQFGARAELYAAAAGFNVKGWLGFDALFIRQPFSFRLDFSAGMGLFRGSSRIAGITVKGTLTGPNPFHVWGKGSISLLFFDIGVPFDRTFGERRPDPELPPADPWAPLAAAIARAENWSAETGTPVGVTVRPPEQAPGLLLLHPSGVATLRQQVVPLNRTLERFGEYAIAGPNRFGITDVLVGDAPAGSWSTVTDRFAPGDFEELSETERISRDSFEEMVAGVRVGADTVDGPLPELKTATLEYETRIIDAPWRSRPQPRYRLDRLVQLAAIRSGSVAAASGRSRFARDDGRAAGVALGPQRYTVATTGSLAAAGDLADGVTKGAAWLAVKHAAPGVAAGVQVVPAHELEEA